jgi:hypothetical protein
MGFARPRLPALLMAHATMEMTCTCNSCIYT